MGLNRGGPTEEAVELAAWGDGAGAVVVRPALRFDHAEGEAAER